VKPLLSVGDIKIYDGSHAPTTPNPRRRPKDRGDDVTDDTGSSTGCHPSPNPPARTDDSRGRGKRRSGMDRKTSKRSKPKRKAEGEVRRKDIAVPPPKVSNGLQIRKVVGSNPTPACEKALKYGRFESVSEKMLTAVYPHKPLKGAPNSCGRVVSGGAA
jgi:hypothetical protein